MGQKYTRISVGRLLPGDTAISSAAYIVALMAAVVLANAVWLFVDKRPLSWDESIHYMGAVGYARVLHQGGWGVIKNLLYLSDFYPPLAEFLAGVVFAVTRPSPDVASFLDVGFLCGMIWLLFIIGRRFFDEPSGILAAYLFVASTAVTIQAKVFMLDIPLAFFVLLGFYAFWASAGFTRRRWSLLYGAALGLGLLDKWSALFFLCFPPLIQAVTATLQKHEQRGRIWLNVLFIYGVAALLAAPWYGVHFITLVKNTSSYVHARGVLENDPALTSPAAWFYYLGSLFRQTSIPLGLALLFGCAWLCLRRKQAAWMIVWLALPYLILTFIRNKDDRYIIPLLPLACLAGAIWLKDLRKPVRERLLLLLVLALLLQMAYSHLGPQAGWLHTLASHRIAQVPLVNSWAPDKRSWPLDAILADVEHQSQQLRRKPILRVVPDHAYFSRVTFVVEQTRRQAGVQLSGINNWPMFTDFAVSKTGSLGLDFNVERPRRIDLMLQIESRALNPRFELVQRYALPDAAEALLYRRREVLSPLPAASVIDVLQSEIKRVLRGYISSAEEYTIQIEPYSEEETRLGRFKKIHLFARNGQVGDFKHNNLGVPFETLDVELQDPILDVEQCEVGQLVVYSLAGLEVKEVVLQESKLNETLSQSKGDVQALRVSAEKGRLLVRWLGLVPMEATLSLRVVSDPDYAESQNLRFRLQRLRLGGVPLPGWLLQPFLEDFNPLFKLSGFPGRILLGRFDLGEASIRMGTRVPKKP
ncbi:phospholipid carrier-dependent glycosyltransferase [candidate division FCPU426 bacterium]|nr:phospholipid carrier-dependent glycosyltransferase [candidate division FCPU426 bacterium]